MLSVVEVFVRSVRNLVVDLDNVDIDIGLDLLYIDIAFNKWILSYYAGADLNVRFGRCRIRQSEIANP